jgi:predicted GNAT family acetyltransferase
MTDMLVKLYELPPLEPTLAHARQSGVEVRRALAAEKHVVLAWIAEQFYPHWVSECDVAFSRQPSSCFVAVEEEKVVGFACYDATCKNFFGPTGVGESQRGRGIGAALLLACLHAMSEQGYAYGIIGGVGPADFYTRIVGATEIPDSTPGIYGDMLSG